MASGCWDNYTHWRPGSRVNDDMGLTLISFFAILCSRVLDQKIVVREGWWKMDHPEKPNVGSGMGWVGAIAVGFILGLILIIREGTKLPLNVVPLFFIHLPLWLLLGAWFRKLMGSINPSEQNFAKNNIDNSALTKGAVLSWFILGLVWLLLVWFPSLKLGDYGIQLNLQFAPIILWAGVAFLMSYHGAVTMQIPRAVWSQIQKIIGFEDSDLKGNAKFRWSTFLQGLAGLLGKGG